mgnify:CR=1 FL=1
MKWNNMNEKEWTIYVDTGFVPMHFFKSMVEAIKSGGTLNHQHMAVYKSHSQVIEMLLAKK